MNQESFMNLVKENNGFEFVIGYKNDVDHYIGGKGNKCWYYIDYGGKKAEYYIGTYENGSCSDIYYTLKGKKLESKTVEENTTINKIIERAYFYQEKTTGKKPQEIEKHGYLCEHYSFGFGEKAVEIVKDYGITVDFNDINDNDSAYHLRDISTDSDVEKPKENE